MKANPGGQLAPNEVVGRSDLISDIWRALERQSVILTAERRMGKTQVIKKMQAEAPKDKLPVYHDLEGVRTALEFVEIVFRDVETFLGVGKRFAEKTRLLLTHLAGAEVAGLKFPEHIAPHWKSLLTHTIEDLVAHQHEKQVVFLWDELPLMLHNIREAQGEKAAMELLDTLRALRQTHPGLRMVFTGSIGLHHVLGALKHAGYINPSTNDMKTVELHPLAEADARLLARELLRGEGLPCGDEAVSRQIAEESSCVPYYIHHVVDALVTAKREITAETVKGIVAARLRDPQDPWEFQHFFDRIPRYYGTEQGPLARDILDALAAAPKPLPLDRMLEDLSARRPVDPEVIRDLLRLLQRDHYIALDEKKGFGFRLGLMQRAWKIQRAL